MVIVKGTCAAHASAKVVKDLPSPERLSTSLLDIAWQWHLQPRVLVVVAGLRLTQSAAAAVIWSV